MTRAPIIFILIILLSSSVYGQQIDSSKKEFSNSIGTARIDSLNEIALRYMQENNKDSAEKYQYLTCTASENQHYTKGLAMAYLTKARIERNLLDNFPAAEAYSRLAINLFQSINENRYNESATDVLWHAMLSQSKYSQAKVHILKKYRLSEIRKDSASLAEMCIYLGNIHLQQGEFDSSFYYASRASEFSPNIAIQLLGTLYRYIGDYPTALRFCKTAFQNEQSKLKTDHSCDIWTTTELAELYAIQQQYDSAMIYYNLLDTSAMTPKDTRIYYTSMAEVLLHQKDYTAALNYFEKALPHHLERNDRSQVIRVQLGIAQCYLGLSRYRLAARHAIDAIDIAMVTRAKQSSMQGYGVLYQAYDHIGEKHLADYYYRKHAQMKDSVAINFLQGKLAALHYEQELDKLNRQKLIIQQQLQINAQQLSQARFTRNTLIGGIALALILTAVLIRNINLGGKRLKDRLKIQHLESNKAHAELQRRYAELEMAALRTQMNPHFIFNCLNAINHFILDNDADLASEYLTKFSRLIRHVLNSAASKYILVSDELATLKTYIELEQLRFKKHVDVVIDIGNVEGDTIFIPPMLIQPFVENAIWHGLMLSKTPALLKIVLRQDHNVLKCIIEDNGIGRAESENVKSKSASHKKSLGIGIIKNRLKLLYNDKNRPPFITILDLHDDKSESSGTRVILEIPLQHVNVSADTINYVHD